MQAHHLTHVAPKARGLKAPDSHAVPLCHRCHTSLHMDGNEARWWAVKGIDPLQAAKTLWQTFGEKTY